MNTGTALPNTTCTEAKVQCGKPVLCGMGDTRITRCAGWLVFFAILLWVYSPVLKGKYAYNDDYPSLARVMDGSFRAIDELSLSQGRLLIFGLMIATAATMARTHFAQRLCRCLRG
ncbi:MAG TPA: hypothetical protein VIT91_06900 [Chthoniobacterales bacterium]